jgi:hypothetical protein
MIDDFLCRPRQHGVPRNVGDAVLTAICVVRVDADSFAHDIRWANKILDELFGLDHENVALIIRSITDKKN